jgi:CheY-like chemotaxis protein
MILVVSSEGKWGTEFICQALSQNGLTTLAGDTSDFKDTLSIHDPALVVANLSGNQETDQEVCQELAIHSSAPILVIAACDDQEYELALFAAGVDDVLVRPIHTPLLIARIRSLLRRYGIPEEYCSTVYSVDDGTGFQAGNDGRSLTRFSLENIVMSNFLNKWVRKLHRWLVWPFILILLTAMLTRGTDFGSMIQKIQAPFMLILAFTGAYLWLLPYLSRWQRKKRQLTNAAKS